MSELKAIRGGDIHDDVEFGYGDEDRASVLYYLKSEADKVIADLELKLAAAQQMLRLNEPKALYSDLETMGRLKHEIDVVARRERHQKYKRCLAMAKLCNEKWLVHNFAEIPTKLGFYDKWYKRWFKIAEQFKEAK